MKSKSSKLLPLLCALLVVGLGLGAWLFLRTTPLPADGVVNAAETAHPEAPDSARSPTVAELPAHKQAATSIAAEESAERTAAKTQADLELADAIWIQGRLVFPEGTPIGEEVDVVANGRKFKTRETYRARVEPNGNFRVAFAAGTKSAKVEIDAAHLFLAESVTLRLADPKRPAELLLEPKLGGSLRGQLSLPAGTADLRSQLVGKSVSSYGWSSDYSNNANRVAKIDENLRFELRGLPAEIEHHLKFDSSLVAPLSVDGLRVKAGDTLLRDFELTLGVRLRGRVSDSGGVLPKNLGLELTWSEGKEEAWQNERDTGKVEKDGSFDLRGVAPGKITIKALGEQRLAASSELEGLEDGDVRDGIELVLQTGGRIAGRVVWPDETPVADARVQLQRQLDPNAEIDAFASFFEDSVAVRTNAQGEFSVSGLAADPYTVLAQAKPLIEQDRSKGKVQTWKATLTDVASTTSDLHLVLMGGCSVSGSVVDDAGAPVKRFRVWAQPGQESGGFPDFSTSGGSAFVTEDGRFELPGLLEGVYTIQVSASQYEAAQPAHVSLPGDSTPLAFVVTRRGSASGLVFRPDGTLAPKAKVSATTDGDNDWGGSGSPANAKGEFRIKSVPTGAIQLRARLDGFASSEPWHAQVAPGQALENVHLVLRVGGRITGEVLASRPGESIQGRVVQASIEDSYENHESTTDASGHFAIEQLEPGEYDVVLEPGADQVKALSGSDTPDGMDWNLHEELQKHQKASVSDGAVTHVVFGSPSRSRVALGGVVRRAAKPASAIRVRCQEIGVEEGGEVLFAVTDAAGHYEFALDARKSYLVQAQPGGSEGTHLGRKVKVPEGGIQGIDFSLPSGRIAGLAVGPDGKALDWVSANLQFHSNAAQAHDEIVPSKSNDSDASTNFNFQDLPAGTYTLELRADITRGRRSNRYDSEERGFAQREIVLREGEEISNLRIEIHLPATLNVHVQLADGSSAGEGEIRVRREGSAWPSWDSFEDGIGEVDDLEAGVYEISAQNSEHLSTAPTRVELVSGQATEVALVLRLGGRLSFSAVDAAGQEIAANVRVFDGEGRELAQVPIESSGSAGPLLPGRCRVVATDRGGHTVEVQAEVVAGETSEVTLTFP